MKKILNCKGFAMVETLIAAVTVVVILTILFNLVYPLVGKYKSSEHYEDIDTKYVAFYIKEMLETDAIFSVGSQGYNPSYNYTFMNYPTHTYACATDSSGVCLTESDGSIRYNTVAEGNTFFTIDTHYTNKNNLCNKLDNNKNNKNNQYFCNRYIDGAKVTNIYLTDYNTINLKNYIKNNASNAKVANLRRSFREYIDFLPTHVNSSKNSAYRLLIVEVEHDSYDTYGDKYYTYASIEVKR